MRRRNRGITRKSIKANITKEGGNPHSISRQAIRDYQTGKSKIQLHKIEAFLLQSS